MPMSDKLRGVAASIQGGFKGKSSSRSESASKKRGPSRKDDPTSTATNGSATEADNVSRNSNTTTATTTTTNAASSAAMHRLPKPHGASAENTTGNSQNNSKRASAASVETLHRPQEPDARASRSAPGSTAAKAVISAGTPASNTDGGISVNDQDKDRRHCIALEVDPRNAGMPTAAKRASGENGDGRAFTSYENSPPSAASLVPQKPVTSSLSSSPRGRTIPIQEPLAQTVAAAAQPKTGAGAHAASEVPASTGLPKSIPTNSNAPTTTAAKSAEQSPDGGRGGGTNASPETKTTEDGKNNERTAGKSSREVSGSELPPVSLSPRAVAVVARIRDVVLRCHYYQQVAQCAERGETLDPSAFPPEAPQWAYPTEEEQVMYEVLLSLYSTPIGPLFINQPEISLSNRSCVLASPSFEKGEVVATYTICAPYSPGTVGRSYFASRKSASVSSSGEDVSALAAAATSVSGAKSSSGSTPSSTSFSLAEAKARKSAVLEKDMRSFSVMKVVSFRLRKEIVRGVINDQCTLTKLNSEHIVRVNDVLKDAFLEKVIVITAFQQRGNLSLRAGKLDDDPERFRRISADVAAGLGVLHAHKVYHHNLKLENVLETADGRACISDAGFYRLFILQCPEALIFNGELACLPPEVFDENGLYSSAEPWLGVAISSPSGVVPPPSTLPSGSGPSGSHNASSNSHGTSGEEGAGAHSAATTALSNSSALSSNSQSRFFLQHQVQQQYMQGAVKVDVWGYGVLLYRLAYGRDPLEIAMRNVEEVRNLVRHHDPVYPAKPSWPFFHELVAVMQACLQKDPAKRPDINDLMHMPYFRNMGSMTGMRNPSSIGSLASGPVSSGVFSGGASTGGGVGGGSSAGAGGVRPTSPGGGVRSRDRNGYTVEAMLGNGRVSQTMVVHQRRNTQRRFAFKVLKKPVLKRVQTAHDHVKASTAVKEARAHAVMRSLAICRKMSHPNLVAYVDIVNDKKGHCFVVQEYMSNPLRAMPAVTGSATNKTPNMERLLSDVLLALVYLHDNEIAHLSLTPSNIFYDEGSGHFRVADFGPLFLTVDEIEHAETKGRPIYALPTWLFAAKPMNKYHVDTFFVGLLAASAVPSVFSTVWDQVQTWRGWQGGKKDSSQEASSRSGSSATSGTAPRVPNTLNVEEILRAVRNSPRPLPPQLVEFIRLALCKGVPARQLLDHPYFGGRFGPGAVPLERLEVSPEEIAAAVKARPQPRDEEQPIVDVLGQDPFAESQVLSSVMVDGDTSLYNNDKSLVISFTGDNLRCGQCRAEMKVALYRCSSCPDVIRCGKCAVSDSHQSGHTLVPFVICTIDRRPDNTRFAQLCHPSSIQDVHALETLEMGANFPVGSLSGQAASQRQMERSMARSTVTNNAGASERFLFGGPDLGSTTYLPDPDCSVSAFGVRSSTSVKPMNSVSNFTFTTHPMLRDPSNSSTVDSSTTGNLLGGGNGGGAAGLGSSLRGSNASGTVGATAGHQTGTNSPGARPNSSHSGGGGGGGNLRNLLMQNQPPAPPSLGGGGKMGLLAKHAKKVALPKAEDLDDHPWEEELRQCREEDLSELLLFNYGFTQVPTEVYTPPPLQVVFLDLSHNNLTSLPHELSFFARLRRLVVSYNKLVELPDSLGNLADLEGIDASHNMLVDLPMTFVYLTKLQSCAMDYNCFKGIPECILDILSPDQAAMGDTVDAPGTDGNGEKEPKSGERGSPKKANDDEASPCSASSSSSDSDEDSQATEGGAPSLRVLYLAANDGIVSFPDIEKLRRFSELKIALDNEPSLYRYYMENDWENQLPNISVTWNKIYPDEIIANLYCGSLRSAQSQMVYEKLKISYVLTVGRGLTPVPPEGGKHRTIIVDDIPGADILASVNEAIEFIDESQRAGSGCLVHCFAGLSRSATTVIAYLMVKKNMRLDEAYLVAKRGRPAILPNSGFFQQLLELDRQLYPNAERPLDIASLGRPEDDEAAANH